MRRLLFIFLILFIPINTFAKEDVLETIRNIKNVQVDENIEILSVSTTDNTIDLNMNINGVDEIKSINYSLDNETLIFQGGKANITKTINNETQQEEITVGDIEENEYAFYIYSILENMASTPYDMNSYFNEENIKNKLENINSEEFDLENKSFDYTDSNNVFGLSLQLNKITPDNKEANIYYKYFINKEYQVPEEEQKQEQEVLKRVESNPNTRNYTKTITILFIFIISLVSYTYIDIKKKRKG